MSKANVRVKIPATLSVKMGQSPELFFMSTPSRSSHDPYSMDSASDCAPAQNSKWLSRDMPVAAFEPLNPEISPEIFADRLNALLRRTALFSRRRLPQTLDELQGMGVDSALMLRLRALYARNPLWDEAELVAIVLYLFTQHPASTLLERDAIRAITKSYKRVNDKGSLEAEVKKCFEHHRVADAWRWNVPA